MTEWKKSTGVSPLRVQLESVVALLEQTKTQLEKEKKEKLDLLQRMMTHEMQQNHRVHK
jgi:hypothetical protein